MGSSCYVSVRRGQAALRESAERLTGAMELARARSEARLIFTGGVGALAGGTSEALAAEQFWRAQGVPVGRVSFEGGSRNTYENAVLSKRLADPQPGERWILVTSAAHMPRAVGVFRAVGWPVIAYPVDFRTTGRLELKKLFDGWLQLDFSERLVELDHAAESWAGLIAYQLMGRTGSLLPAPWSAARTGLALEMEPQPKAVWQFVRRSSVSAAGLRSTGHQPQPDSYSLRRARARYDMPASGSRPMTIGCSHSRPA